MPHNSPPACEPWGPLPDLHPVQEYQTLLRDLQELLPNAPLWHLDCLVVREMALYGGHSIAVITQAMVQASLYLADHQPDDAQHYVERIVQAALCQEATDTTGLGWGV